MAKLDAEIEELRDSIFFFIKSLDETSVRGSSFYITVLAYLTDIAQSLEFISKKSYKHVNNNHKPLRYNQITDLREIDDLLENFLKEIEEIFANRKLDQIQKIVEHKEEVLAKLSEKLKNRSKEPGLKNPAQKIPLCISICCWRPKISSMRL